MSDDGLSQSVLYNPRQLRADTLKAIFAARKPLLERLLADLGQSRPSHKLLIGTRGMGKTTILRRLALAIEDDPKLSARWTPLSFPEEQYNVGSLGEFYLNCLDALADYLEKHDSHDAAEKVDQIVQELRTLDDQKLIEQGDRALREQARSRGRSFVLLVDNLSILFERLEEKEKWALRNFLSHAESPVLVGASAEFIDDVGNHGKAFYEYLQIHELRGCNNQEAEAVLRQLAETFQQPKVVKWIEDDRARLATLNRLAGGAPRTLVMLFQLIVQGPDGNIMDELERLLDLATPLYKARLEELPDQAQRVVDALALHWDPASRRDLEQVLRLDGNAISSQLNRLSKQGFVEQVDLPHEARVGYQIAERFFNIWYLMRTSRRTRHQLRWLVEFLRAFYSDVELTGYARKCMIGGEPNAGDPVRRAQRLFAYGQVIHDDELREELENNAFYLLSRAEEDVAEKLDLSDVDRNWRARLAKLKEASERERFILDEIKLNSNSVHAHIELGRLYRDEFKNFKAAEQAFRQAVAVAPGYDVACYYLGQSLTRNPATFTDAEAFLLRAVQLDPGWGLVWTKLGELYIQQGRIAEARNTYFKATETRIGSGYCWLSLGIFLQDVTNELEEAKAAFEKAVHFEPDNLHFRIRLGTVLEEMDDFCGAESAYREAARLAPTDGFGWYMLGVFLARQGRVSEAEQALRKAVEVDPDYLNAKYALGYWLTEWNRSLDEAEKLVREALKYRSSFLSPLLLCRILARMGRIGESVECVKHHFQRSPEKLLEDSPQVLSFLRELVPTGHVDASCQLLVDLKLTERARPLAEALSAIKAGDREQLKRINPEQRESAEKIFDYLVAPIPLPTETTEGADDPESRQIE